MCFIWCAMVIVIRRDAADNEADVVVRARCAWQRGDVAPRRCDSMHGIHESGRPRARALRRCELSWNEYIE